MQNANVQLTLKIQGNAVSERLSVKWETKPFNKFHSALSVSNKIELPEQTLTLKICMHVVTTQQDPTRPPKTYKYMHRQWILIGQSFLKTIRTIGD